MRQMTWRASDELMARVRAAAARHGRSLNDYVSSVLDAATNPELSGSAAEQVRERLAAAGILVPPGRPRRRPSKQAFEAARRAAGKGTRPSDLVSESRG
ncbi:MAG TPA: toxin-antitoxin system HicB family antitoxin [Mycobacteriales bacterium]|jgi:plasmid stability protein|nr:toxin-antitoxin system HicB family antitoxin [Mycobacteriales bacterium]